MEFEELVQSTRDLVKWLEQMAATHEMPHAHMDLLKNLKALLSQYDNEALR
jgi:hypothetical protein